MRISPKAGACEPRIRLLGSALLLAFGTIAAACSDAAIAGAGDLTNDSAVGADADAAAADGAAADDGGPNGPGNVGVTDAGDGGNGGNGGNGGDGGTSTVDGSVGVVSGWRSISTSGAPTGRGLHAAVWTGHEMIVWGGQAYDASNNPIYLSTGGRYDPATDTWHPLSTTGAPAGRALPAAVWAGTEMIVWGGFDGGFRGDGARYDPVTDTWHAMSATAAPSARSGHAFAWTGTELVVWGGETGAGGLATTFLANGGRYSPAQDRWVATPTTNAPAPRSEASFVWTGSALLVWGGYSDAPASGPWEHSDGSAYDVAAGAWSPLSFVGPQGRFVAPAIWTGTDMIVWGGNGGAQLLGDGARYTRALDSWTPTMSIGSPPARIRHSVVWTGSRLVVWGGASVASSAHFASDGAAYDPAANHWDALPSAHAPTGRADHSAVWTGQEMIVWGGLGSLADGGRWAP